MMCLRGEEKLQSIHLDGEKGLISGTLFNFLLKIYY